MGGDQHFEQPNDNQVERPIFRISKKILYLFKLFEL